MVTSSSRLAYNDVFPLLDKALAEPKGIRLRFASQELAWHFRLRLHTARRIDRKDNQMIYPDLEHPMHGRSIYDDIAARIRPDGEEGVWLYLEKISAREFEVESLSEVEEEIDDNPIPRRPVVEAIKRRV